MAPEQREKNRHDPAAGLPPEEGEVGIDFRHLAHVVWSYKWLILVCVVVFVGLAKLQLDRSPVLYSSTAEIKYEPEGLPVLDFGERSSVLYQRDEIRTAVELVKSSAVARRVLESLGSGAPEPVHDNSPVSSVTRSLKDFLRYARGFFVSEVPEQVPAEQLAEQTAVSELLEGLTVRQIEDTKLIAITYAGSEQRKTAEIANEFAEQFIRYLNDDESQAMSYAREFLNEEVEEAKDNLRRAEQALFDYSGQSDLRVMDENLNIAINTMTSLTNEVEKIKNEIASLEAEAKAASEEGTQPTVFDEDPMISSLMRRLTDLEIERLSMEAVNREDFPELQRVEREMNGIRAQIEKLTSQQASESQSRLRFAQLRLESLENRLSEQRDKVHAIEEKMIDYRAFKREVESAQEIYSSLLDQYKRIEVKDDVTESNVTITEPAPLPTVPTSPKVKQTLVIFITLGLVFGVGLALVLNWSDRSVKNPALVEERLGLPALGYVPYIRQRKSLLKKRPEKGPVLVDRQEGGGVSEEAFHYLRTSLQYCSARQPRVILLTSCVPQEGKSTISSNLAFSYAQGGQKTLLIDADLKRPTLHKAFSKERAPGLSDVLTEQAKFEDAVIPSGQENLDLLVAGQITPSPVNLLDSQAMTDLLERLRGEYGIILLDSAPSHGMADSLVLCTKVDGVCLVVKTGQTAMEVLSKTTASIRFLGANLLGAIYNTGRERRVDYGYGYSPAYAYSYRPKTAENPTPTK